MRVGFLKFSHASETGFYSKLSSGLHSSAPPTREYILYIQVLHPLESIFYTFKYSPQRPPTRVYCTHTFNYSHSTHNRVYSKHSSTPPNSTHKRVYIRFSCIYSISSSIWCVLKEYLKIKDLKQCLSSSHSENKLVKPATVLTLNLNQLLYLQ